jgi:hypothetical protein
MQARVQVDIRQVVEIEIGVLRSQCPDRRIDSKERLVSEIAAWEQQRNASRARIKWMFTTEKARAKMGALTRNSRPKSHNHCDEAGGRGERPHPEPRSPSAPRECKQVPVKSFHMRDGQTVRGVLVHFELAA